MNGKRYNKFLTIILIIVILAVIALLAYLGYSYYSNYSINKDAEDFVDAFIEEATVDTPSEENVVTNSGIENVAVSDGANTTTENNTNSTSSTSTSGKKTTYKGFEVVGTIQIPKTSVKLPILAKVTRKSLETSVAVVWPENVPVNTVGNIVISGHNYRNGVFFSNNKKLSSGDRIYITGIDGTKVTYIIYKIFETTDTDTKFYNRDTDGKREITLSTCTDDGSARLIIQAREE